MLSCGISHLLSCFYYFYFSVGRFGLLSVSSLERDCWSGTHHRKERACLFLLHVSQTGSSSGSLLKALWRRQLLVT